MKKALITGIAGQDGSYLAELLGWSRTKSFVEIVEDIIDNEMQLYKDVKYSG